VASWKQRVVSSIAVMALAGLPVAAMVCALLCVPGLAAAEAAPLAPVAHHHPTPAARQHASGPAEHHAGTNSHHAPEAEASRPDAGRADQRITSPAVRGCPTHDGTTAVAKATLTTGRAEIGALPAISDGPHARTAFAPNPARHAYTPPPHRIAAHTSPVLRI
jgi:hypothetical protein